MSFGADVPQEDPEVTRRRKQEQARADALRLSEAQDNLRNATETRLRRFGGTSVLSSGTPSSTTASANPNVLFFGIDQSMKPTRYGSPRNKPFGLFDAQGNRSTYNGRSLLGKNG